ncbi:hypothetical protein [Methylogaea oryzae]|uniref:hypothetical protein n=1 Tax=Methylogaea oryzae TaxID=1295382 RepID=UPI000A45D079|nr:hypothetical protein [Methylogaea oryzae]
MGQDTDSGFLKAIPDIQFKSDGTVMVDANMMTGHAGIFAGGDMVPSERTVTVAVGHGKKAARCIDAYLSGTQYVKPPKHDIVGYEKLHTCTSPRPSSVIKAPWRRSSAPTALPKWCMA